MDTNTQIRNLRETKHPKILLKEFIDRDIHRTDWSDEDNYQFTLVEHLCRPDTTTDAVDAPNKSLKQSIFKATLAFRGLTVEVANSKKKVTEELAYNALLDKIELERPVLLKKILDTLTQERKPHILELEVHKLLEQIHTMTLAKVNDALFYTTELFDVKYQNWLDAKPADEMHTAQLLDRYTGKEYVAITNMGCRHERIHANLGTPVALSLCSGIKDIANVDRRTNRLWINDDLRVPKFFHFFYDHTQYRLRNLHNSMPSDAVFPLVFTNHAKIHCPQCKFSMSNVIVRSVNDELRPDPQRGIMSAINELIDNDSSRFFENLDNGERSIVALFTRTGDRLSLYSAIPIEYRCRTSDFNFSNSLSDDESELIVDTRL